MNALVKLCVRYAHSYFYFRIATFVLQKRDNECLRIIHRLNAFHFSSFPCFGIFWHLKLKCAEQFRISPSRAKLRAMNEAICYEFGHGFEFICDVPIVGGALDAPIEAPKAVALHEANLEWEVMTEGLIGDSIYAWDESADQCSDDDMNIRARNRRIYNVLAHQPIPAALAAIPGALFVWSEMKQIQSSKWNVATLSELYGLLVTHILLRYRGIKDWKSCKHNEAETWSLRCKRIGGQPITPAQVQEWVRNTFKRTNFKKWMGKLDDVVLGVQNPQPTFAISKRKQEIINNNSK